MRFRAFPFCLLLLSPLRWKVILKREALKNLMENTGKAAGDASLRSADIKSENGIALKKSGVRNSQTLQAKMFHHLLDSRRSKCEEHGYSPGKGI